VRQSSFRLSSGFCLRSNKRPALCIEAVNTPWTVLGATWIGLILAPSMLWLLWHVNWKLAIASFFPCWMLPTLIAEDEPYLFTALIRRMFYGNFYE
jgi:hypothetical protein